jgi:hypothetical protein
VSDPRTKAERSAAKDRRQMPASDEPRIKGKSKRHAPVIVEAKWIHRAFMLMDQEFRKYGSYRTREIAEKVIADQERKHPGLHEFRIREDRFYRGDT